MKKIISVLLCVLMLFSLSAPAFAAEESSYDGEPLVIVRGINYFGLYKEDGSPALKISLGDIFGLVKSVFVDTFIEKKEGALFNNTLSLLDNVLSPIANDKEGNSLRELTFDKYDGPMSLYKGEVDAFENTGETGIIKAAGDKIGYENVYFFTYDWRRSAKELAGDLNSYLEDVITETGKNKVNIAAVSMGGMVTTAYMYYYGTERINNLTYVSSAHNGTFSCGDCLNGNIYFDGTVFYQHTKKLGANNSIIDFFVEIMRKIGLFDLAGGILNKVVEANPEALDNDVLRNNLGTLLGLWSLCPDEVFDSGVEFIFGGHEEEFPELMNKIAEVRDFIFSTEDIIDSAINDGVKVTFVSNYGLPLRPYFENSYLLGDTVIETRFTSNFAVTAPTGEVLSEEQIAAADPAYLSPDNIIDATTANYRDVTWFVKNAPHVAAEYQSDYAEFVLWLCLNDGYPDITAEGKYPQFMTLDGEKKLVATE